MTTWGHHLIIVTPRTQGKFDELKYWLDNGAELISSVGAQNGIAYTLRKPVKTYAEPQPIRQRQPDAIIGWSVAVSNLHGDAVTHHDFEFEDDAVKWVEEQKAAIWHYPHAKESTEPSIPEVSALINLLRENIKAWAYPTSERVEGYNLGLNTGLKYALEEVDKLFPPDADDSNV